MTIIIISLLLLASLLPHLTFTAHVNVGIVNGREADAHSRPYMVSVQLYGEHNCGGFLITNDLVLTAAHCWNKRDILTVVVGAHDLRMINSSDHIKVNAYIQHPNYKSYPIRNDIMLLKLEEKVELNTSVGLIQLSEEGDVKEGTRCIVAGWGRLETNGTLSNVLMEADTTIINQAECQSRWGFDYLASQMICAYGDGGSCFGDSGGPLVCGDTAVGVTSFVLSNSCNSRTHPNVYTKISAFLQWFQAQM